MGNQIEVSDQFRKLCSSFYGCTIGNVYAPVWICGLEWGGGLDKDYPVSEHTLEPYGLEALPTWDRKEIWDDWGRKGYFNDAVEKILWALKKGEVSQKKTDEKLEEEDLFGLIKGMGLILNAYPISFPDRSEARKCWDSYKVRTKDGRVVSIKEWSGLQTIEEYFEAVIPIRSKLFIRARKTLTPRVIVAMGKTVDMKSLWGVDSNPIEDISIHGCEFYCLDNGPNKPKTLLVWTPFPNPGFRSFAQYEDVFLERILKICEAEYGEGALKRPLKQLSEPNKNCIQFRKALRHAQWGISDFREQAHKTLTKLEDLTQKEDLVFEQSENASKILTSSLEAIKTIKAIKNSVDILDQTLKEELDKLNKSIFGKEGIGL